jgi:hypothetical protein
MTLLFHLERYAVSAPAGSALYRLVKADSVMVAISVLRAGSGTKVWFLSGTYLELV